MTIATPRTDAVALQAFETDEPNWVVYADFARELEREISELEDEARAANVRADQMAAEWWKLRTALTGISTCSTCEACRGAALRALGEKTSQAACQHDKTKPNPTLVPLGSAAHGSSDWLWACSVCDDRFRMPVGTAETTGDGAK